MESNFHTSVLYKEVLDALNIREGEIYIDATLGGGGHANGILERGGNVLGLDVDPDAVKFVAREHALGLAEREGRLFAESKNIRIVQGNFVQLQAIASQFGVLGASGVLFDLGMSSFQLENAERGFSFNKKGPLDMRMDPTLTVKAADLVNGLNEGELYELFNKYGEEPNSRRLSRIIGKYRLKKRIETTDELAKIIEEGVGRRGRIHGATRVFQALRIAVNDELHNLQDGLEQSARLLKSNGRLVVISFHSLEDRLVKNFFKKRKELVVLTPKPILPSSEEILRNPRSRSAKMRVAEKINN